MALNGDDPRVDAAEPPRDSDSEQKRTSERRRVRRRTRVENRVRAKIRMRVWLACTGALIVMALGIYYALGHDGVSRNGDRPGVVRVVEASRGVARAPLG